MREFRNFFQGRESEEYLCPLPEGDGKGYVLDLFSIVVSCTFKKNKSPPQNSPPPLDPGMYKKTESN